MASVPAGVPHDPQGGPPAEKVENLPGSPSSLSVALSSLLTLGGWRLVRQARHVHLVSLPEWYHEGGPGQIGHATPLDLNRSLHVLPVCWYQPDGPGIGRQRFAHDSQPERYSVWNSQYFIPTSAPRGPPGLS